MTRGGGTNLDAPTWERRTEELLQHVPLVKTSLAAMHKLVDLIATYEAKYGGMFLGSATKGQLYHGKGRELQERDADYDKGMHRAMFHVYQAAMDGRCTRMK